MNLELINNLVKDVKDNKFVQDFIKELSDNLLNENKGKGNNELQEKELSQNGLREENCLYQVVDIGANGVYLQNTRNNKVFEETDISQEIQDVIENDYILRYQDGKYVIEEELTDDFFNSMVGIKEYKEIQNDFIEKSNILKIAPDTRFNVISRNKDYTVLGYENTKKNQIEVPNALLPYFMDEDTVLYYKDGRFEKDV